jgi:hypothetical protein
MGSLLHMLINARFAVKVKAHLDAGSAAAGIVCKAAAAAAVTLYDECLSVEACKPN